MEKRTYELLVVLDPTLLEDQQVALHGRIADTITKYGGTVSTRDDWGKKRLAYEIGKRREGIYSLYLFEGAPKDEELLNEVNRLARIEEGIMRFIVVRSEVGKSKGDPALWERAMAASSMNSGRGPRHGGGRNVQLTPADEAEFIRAEPEER